MNEVCVSSHSCYLYSMHERLAEIYTDGSCHTQLKIGAWVAIVFTGTYKTILSGTVKDTTHHRMELMAVVKGVEYIKTHLANITSVIVYTDSQYVAGLPQRKENLVNADFITGTGKLLQNADLIQVFLESISKLPIRFVKIKAHQKSNGEVNHNREADMLSRKLLRTAVEEIVS
jgi:ribonuclease HI